ncbi:MAG: hypothetical protein HY537_12795 [Deltaproteobacteria bacterium]|nr:hypothetical protein [Deltaproteobacteria bacterium]
MKILSDFDGVLTDPSPEAARVKEVFYNHFITLPGTSQPQMSELWEQAQNQLIHSPHQHGWKSGEKITAYANEDGFIECNGLAACLDDMVSKAEKRSLNVQNSLKQKEFSNFCEMSQFAFNEVVKETSAGRHHPLDPSAAIVFQTLLSRGIEIVIVSNSGTERITNLFLQRCPGLLQSSENRLRIRGGAQKFVLGENSDSFEVGPYVVHTDRPKYQTILVEEKPDIILGDVFSLDLALPLQLARRKLHGFEKVRLLMRKRNYSPQWSTAYFSHTKGVSCGLFESLDDLLALI